MAFAGALLGYCCLMVVLGILRIPFRCPPCLLLESALNILIGLGYIPCLAFYFLKLQEVYNSQTCQDRQQMYSSKGIQGYSCGMSGTDIAGGLFGVIGIIIFPFGAILAIRAFRRVQQLKQGPQGALQLLEVLLNILVLVCVVSSFVSLSGFSSASAGFAGGSLSLDTMSYPFQGTELQLVRDLDQKFSIERAPLLYGSLAVSLGLGALTLGIMIGNARLHSRFWILLEIIFSIIAAAAYLAGTAVYLHFVLQINRTDLCKQRAQLYARNGFTWMNCEVSGTDGAAAFFGLVLVVFYTASTVLAALQWKRIERLDE
ncbi:MALD3 protein, partial [Polypterus senegalus]